MQQKTMLTTMFTTPIIRPLLRGFSRITLKLLGWKVVGNMPEDIKQCVLIAAPHTTNWDMPLSLMIAFSLKTQLHWVGKQSIFKFPFGGLMRWMGGIPVDRSHANNMVNATIEKFKEFPELRIMMAPEGTRARVTQWKSGFYHIAHGAQVPIVLAFVDYKNKRGGIGKMFTTSGDYEKDIIVIREFYKPLYTPLDTPLENSH
jgi:1-acyl-sn-glycerol-3-phosphate acyltransferase